MEKRINKIQKINFILIFKFYGMPTLLYFKQLIKQADFFNSSQLLRYEKEPEYRTFTGGLISVGIIITIIIAFASMIVDTVNRTIINFTQNSQSYVDPPLSTITASSDNFMFGVQVWGYNLSSKNRLFDVVFQQVQSSYGLNYTYTSYPLQQCTQEHWAMLPDVVSKFSLLNVANWLCPTIGTIIKLQGKYSSKIYNQFSVTLYPCRNSTDPARPCGTPQEIDQFFSNNGQWSYFTYYYVNSIVNPAQPDYKSYYLEDRAYISFGNQLGAQMDLYLSQIDIQSDNSIWPFSDMQEDKVYNIPFSPILYPYTVTNGTSYANFYIMKNPTQTNYSRAVQKIFVVLSFMGGLIGAVMAGLFIMNSYASFAFQLALALQLFKQSQYSTTHKQLKQEHNATINLMHFIQYYIYLIGKKIVKKINWPFIKYIHECREEIHQQLDIKGLIKRVIFLEYAITYVLQDFHLSEMQLKRPVLPSQIKALRQKILAKEVLLQESSSEASIKDAIPPYDQMDSVIQKQVIPSKIDCVKDNIRFEKICPEAVNIDNLETINRVANEFQPSNKNPVKKLFINRKRLRESALQGNEISKKLLMVMMGSAGKQSDSQSMLSELENISSSSLNNSKGIPLVKATQR